MCKEEPSHTDFLFWINPTSRHAAFKKASQHNSSISNVSLPSPTEMDSALPITSFHIRLSANMPSSDVSFAT